jgi:hypothetical protein
MVNYFFGRLFTSPKTLIFITPPPQRKKERKKKRKKGEEDKCKISGLRLDVNVLCALLGFYAA